MLIFILLIAIPGNQPLNRLLYNQSYFLQKRQLQRLSDFTDFRTSLITADIDSSENRYAFKHQYLIAVKRRGCLHPFVVDAGEYGCNV